MRAATGRRRLRAWVILGVAAVGLLLAAAVISVYLGSIFGVQVALFSAAVAAIPLGIVIPTFLWLDRFEAEPTRFLLLAFGWGAFAATIISALLNTSAQAALKAVTDPESAALGTAVLVAPIVEETFKGLLVLLVWWLLRREFDGVTDGIVYAGVAAAGFAFTENIQYLAVAYQEGGTEAFTWTFVLRCLMAPFAHPMFTILTGIGVGVAATSRSRWAKVIAPVVGLALAILLHGLWNLGASLGGSGYLTIYFLVEVPIFLAFIGLIVWTRRREGRLIGRFLQPYADAGWLSESEVAMLGSMGRRREARVWARANAGTQGLAAMREFQDSASELALLRHRMSHSAADEHALATERLLMADLVARRRQFIGQAVA